jgi:hypothetical protein
MSPTYHNVLCTSTRVGTGRFTVKAYLRGVEEVSALLCQFTAIHTGVFWFDVTVPIIIISFITSRGHYKVICYQ